MLQKKYTETRKFPGLFLEAIVVPLFALLLK